MNWFIVVYFLVNGSWIEADQLEKEGWSPISQSSYEICINKLPPLYKKEDYLSVMSRLKSLSSITNAIL